MTSISPIGFRDLDDLRMIGLSRVPRCAGCPRFRVLALAVEKRSPSPALLPAAPRSCNHRICQPLVTRFSHGGAKIVAPFEQLPVTQGFAPSPVWDRQERD